MVLLHRNESVSIVPSVMFVFPVEEKHYSVCTPKVQHVMHPHPQVCKGYLTSCHPSFPRGYVTQDLKSLIIDIPNEQNHKLFSENLLNVQERVRTNSLFWG
jgi:hypothetical protein